MDVADLARVRFTTDAVVSHTASVVNRTLARSATSTSISITSPVWGGSTLW